MLAHYGFQKFDGTDRRLAGTSCPTCSNDDVFSYDDWKIGATYDLGKATEVLKGATLGAYYTNTSGASSLGYGGRGEGGFYPKTISGDNFTVYLQKAF